MNAGSFLEGPLQDGSKLSLAIQRFEDIVDSTDGIVWESDARTFVFSYVSAAAERILGFPVQQWYQPGFWLAHLHPDDRDWAAKYCASCSGHLQNHDFEYRFIARDGRTVWLRDIVRVVSEDGAPRWLRGVMVDITESKLTSQRCEMVIASAMDGVLFVARDARILRCNQVMAKLTGYEMDELPGLSIMTLETLESAEDISQHMTHVIQRGTHRFESRWRRKDGKTIDVELTATYLSLGEEFCAFVRDITFIKEHEREIERIAHYDSLTGIPNRSLLSDRMLLAMAQSRRHKTLLAVCYLDLDDFKPINDACGHDVGDQVLIEVAQRLEGCLRGGDTVARIGGDEFVLLLQGFASFKECSETVARILKSICQPMAFGVNELSISASLGVTLYPDDDTSPDTLLRHADQAMYLAKRSGRNRFHLYDLEEDMLAQSRANEIGRIEQALLNHEFMLYYQPQVDLQSGRVIGAEALIRWQHPERGLLLPAEFLPIIDNHPLEIALGDWVIATALEQIEIWSTSGMDLLVSINVTAQQLHQADFTRKLALELAHHPSVRPEQLKLEVLETSTMKDLEAASSVIRACRDIRVSFSLDDFGTGYSSLTYLRRLPVETLKIDQSFVRGMLESSDDLAIINGILGMAKAFNLSVIAEGVETVEHGNMLIRLGCCIAQGYGIARPMPAGALLEWINEWLPEPSWSAEARQISTLQLSALYAEVEHRNWLRSAEKALLANTEAALATDHQCRFARWLDNDARTGLGRQADFERLYDAHHRIHTLAEKLMADKNQGLLSDTMSAIAQLRDLSDTLLKELYHLIRHA